MLIYLIVFISILILMYLYQNSTNKNLSMIYLLSVFYILFFFLSLRYNTGADYVNYTVFINEILEKNDYFHFEIGWAPLFFIMDVLNLNAHFFFVITSFITSLLILKSIPKENAVVGISLYLCLGYIELFSVVRQCFGATIFTFFLSLFDKTGKKRFLFIGTILGSLFHKSILILIAIIPIVLIFQKMTNNMTNKKNVFLFFLLVIFFSVFNIGDFVIEKILPLTSYAIYARMGDALIGTQRKGTGLGVLLRYLICLGVLFYYKPTGMSFEEQFDSNKKVKIGFTYVLTFLFVISNEIAVFMRLPLLLNTSLCVFYDGKPNKYRKLQNLFLVTLCFLLYLATIMKSTRDIKGSWKLLPYYSIFEYGLF